MKSCYQTVQLSIVLHVLTLALVKEVGLWSFQVEGIKLEIFLHKNQYTQRKLLDSEFLINGELSKIVKNFVLILSKIDNNKNVLLIWYSSMKKI